ncbi:phosphopentomutase/phosphoglucosamine mutase [Halovivax sp.]|uniref:phosphopentomutase/phosphoglucosamine mutase n=1 Tax=Halovivax sp. TaxID=1935978 RepID=UPI0037434E6A
MSLFGTSGVRGPVGETVTAELALSVGRAVGSAAARVVVGRDVRESGAVLESAVHAGVRECGADVVDVGVASTPTIARSVGWRGADAGIAITASHNPPEDNGLKLWSASGRAFDRDRLAAVERRIERGEYELAAWNEIGSYESWSEATDRHVAALAGAVDVPGEPAVVIDVGSGTGVVTARALRELGCRVETLNADPDGAFPARPSEPTADNCETLVTLVAATDADLGIAHDGDADRMLAVAEDGAVVGGDTLLALFGRDAARVGSNASGAARSNASGAASGDDASEAHRGPESAREAREETARDRAASDGGEPAVAAPVNTSLAVDDALAEVGATVTRTRVGDGFVAARAAEPDVVFGGEPSGAWIWPEETRCPDGPLAACRLAALVAREGPLSELVDGVPSYPIRRTSIEVEPAEKAAIVDRVAAAVADGAGPDSVEAVDDRDGLRVDLGDAWYLIRASGTQPLVRVTAEARNPERADVVFEAAGELVADVA